MPRRTLTLVIKELIIVLRDKQSRLVIAAPVLMQVLLFPFAATLEVTNASLGIDSKDSGQASVEITQRLAKTSAFSRVRLFPDSRSADQALDEQRILLLVRFPSDFSRGLATGEGATLQVILDGRRSNSAQIAMNHIQQIVLDYQLECLSNGGQHPLPAQLEIRNWHNVNLDYKWFVLPSLIALITTVGVLILTSLSVAREREHGTLDQILVSPLTTGQIFVGKAVPALIVASFQGAVILFFGIFVYRIPFSGSLPLFYGCMLAYGLSLVGFGLFISALCATQQQAFIGVFLFMVPAVLLSGYIAPVENMPEWLQYASLLNPVRHFTEITKQIYLKGAGLTLIWPNLWPLFLIFACTSTLSYGIFRRNMS